MKRKFKFEGATFGGVFTDEIITGSDYFTIPSFGLTVDLLMDKTHAHVMPPVPCFTADFMTTRCNQTLDFLTVWGKGYSALYSVVTCAAHNEYSVRLVKLAYKGIPSNIMRFSSMIQHLAR